MLKQLKRALKKYDSWCQEMGLTEDQKRCCVPVKREDIIEQKEQADKIKKSQEDNV